METTASAIFFTSAAERESPADDELPLQVQDGVPGLNYFYTPAGKQSLPAGVS